MQERFQLNIKLGVVEFSADGPQAEVKEAFAGFLKALESIPQLSSLSTTVTTDALKQTPALRPNKDTLLRLFRVYSDFVMLRLIPETKDKEADSIILLLLGFRVLLDQKEVGAAELLAAAQTSGLKIRRLDRIIVPYRHLLDTEGFKRGTKYSLTDEGVLVAEAKAMSLIG